MITSSAISTEDQFRNWLSVHRVSAVCSCVLNSTFACNQLLTYKQTYATINEESIKAVCMNFPMITQLSKISSVVHLRDKITINNHQLCCSVTVRNKLILWTSSIVYNCVRKVSCIGEWFATAADQTRKQKLWETTCSQERTIHVSRYLLHKSHFVKTYFQWRRDWLIAKSIIACAIHKLR